MRGLDLRHCGFAAARGSGELRYFAAGKAMAAAAAEDTVEVIGTGADVGVEGLGPEGLCPEGLGCGDGVETVWSMLAVTWRVYWGGPYGSLRTERGRS